MPTSHAPSDSAIGCDRDFLSRLKQSAIALYELPIEFWEKVLDREMHFHLGLFPADHTSFEDSMKLAVQQLALNVPLTRPIRVLDVGCGWGGPAFQLNQMWGSEVLGLTISRRQTSYVNSRAKTTGSPIYAQTVDADEFDFTGIGKFDVLWLYDSLDHMVNREQLFDSLHNAATPDCCIALATHCRSPQTGQQLYGDYMGIQPIQSTMQIVDMLENRGWRVLNVDDCTSLTFPVWNHWIQNLNSLQGYPEANRLSAALAETAESYRNGMLRCVQLIARRK